MAGLVCGLFILDCVETATGRPVPLFRLGVVVAGIVAIFNLVFHVSEIASFPIALLLGWKFEDFLLRYSAAKAIRELKAKADVEGLLKQ